MRVWLFIVSLLKDSEILLVFLLTQFNPVKLKQLYVVPLVYDSFWSLFKFDVN